MADPKDFNYVQLLEPKDRECVICGVEYHGVRNICMSIYCQWESEARYRDSQRRHPQTHPAGILFYMDYLKLGETDENKG